MNFTLHSEGVDLHGAVLAAPENPRAVMSLVHGFGEHSGRYVGMADALSKHGIATVTIDLRGHGRSGGPQGELSSYDAFRSDLRALLGATREHFSGVPHILYGHSMGGGLVLNHLLHAPEDGHDLYGVIASAPLLELADPPPKPAQWLLRGVQKIKPHMRLPNAVDGSKISTLPSEQAAYIHDPLNHGEMGLSLAMHLIDAGQFALKQAKDWDTPLLMLHSREDQLTDFTASQDFAARAQNCDFHPFETVAHEMHNDSSRDDVYALMADFILAKTATQGQRS